MIGNVAGDLVGPLINKKAIQAEYLTANARQLQAIYNYQRVILNAFTEVINRVSMVENYSKSIEIKKQQLESLEASVEVANNLFQNARVEYIDVLFAQRDLMDARMVLIDTKTAATVRHREHLSSPRRRQLSVSASRPETAATSPATNSPLVASFKTHQSEQGGGRGSETGSRAGQFRPKGHRKQSRIWNRLPQ